MNTDNGGIYLHASVAFSADVPNRRWSLRDESIQIPFAQAQRAYEAILKGHTRGKSALIF